VGTFRVTVVIDRPPAEVFAVVAEPRTMPRWYEAVERVVQVNATSYQVTRSLPGGRVDNLVDVAVSDSKDTVTLESRRGPTPFRYRFTMEPEGVGTVLTLDGEISSAGLPGPLEHLDLIATAAFKKGMRQNLEHLRGIVESNDAMA
jgi:Polyketide cyclase / dehydrase and lipid transport